VAKYNRLLRVEHKLGENAVFAGEHMTDPYHLLQ